MKAKIVVLPGDGIGPEITAVAQKVLEKIASKFGHEFEFEAHLIGGAAIDETGTPLPEPTLAACKSARAVLLGRPLIWGLACGGSEVGIPGLNIFFQQIKFIVFDIRTSKDKYSIRN